jgi:hypothetical protein
VTTVDVYIRKADGSTSFSLLNCFFGTPLPSCGGPGHRAAAAQDRTAHGAGHLSAHPWLGSTPVWSMSPGLDADSSRPAALASGARGEQFTRLWPTLSPR